MLGAERPTVLESENLGSESATTNCVAWGGETTLSETVLLLFMSKMRKMLFGSTILVTIKINNYYK